MAYLFMFLKKKSKKKKLNNSGMTLVEMIVVFALLGILITAGSQLIASSSQVYYHSSAQNSGLKVSQMIVSEIEYELNQLPADRDIPENGDFLKLDEAFSSAAYDGYSITYIKLEKCGENTDNSAYPDWIVKLKLEISHPMYGSFESEEYIPIYSRR